MSLPPSDPEMWPPPVKETLAIGKGKPGPGRPKGIPNRTTALLKDAILCAAEAAGNKLADKEGMIGYLTVQAENNPGPFMALLGKVLPMQVGGDPEGGPVRMVVERRIVDPVIRPD